MAYIYKITNDVNQKIYIGKTENSISTRFKEHCRDSRKQTEEHRPLYAAMRKYGVEHFHIELLEETDKPEEREKYWIETLGSFKYGYNATRGGDGCSYIDYDKVVETYHQLQSIVKVAQNLHIDKGTVRKILDNKKEVVYTSQETNRRRGKLVNQYSLDNEYIQTFSTMHDAARYIRPNSSSFGGVASHIGDVCNGKRHTAYGYIWKYAEI